MQGFAEPDYARWKSGLAKRLVGRAVVYALAFAVPGVYPVALSGSEGVAGHANHVSYIALRKILVPVAFGIPEIDPVTEFRNEEGGAEASDLPNVACRNAFVAVTFFIVQIYPVAVGFYAGDNLSLFLRNVC